MLAQAAAEARCCRRSQAVFVSARTPCLGRSGRPPNRSMILRIVRSTLNIEIRLRSEQTAKSWQLSRPAWPPGDRRAACRDPNAQVRARRSPRWQTSAADDAESDGPAWFPKRRVVALPYTPLGFRVFGLSICIYVMSIYIYIYMIIYIYIY